MTTTHEQLLMAVKDFSEHMLSEEKKWLYIYNATEGKEKEEAAARFDEVKSLERWLLRAIQIYDNFGTETDIKMTFLEYGQEADDDSKGEAGKNTKGTDL